MPQDFKTRPSYNGTDLPLSSEVAPASHVGSRDGHPLATGGATPADGFMAGADKEKLDGLSGQATGAFSAYKNTAQLDIPNATWVKTTFDAEEYDTSGWYDVVNSRYVPQRAGRYRLSATVTITPASDGGAFLAAIYKNGVGYKYLVKNHTSRVDSVIAGGSVQVDANGTTDYFEVYVLHLFGTNTPDMNPSNEFQIFQGEYIGT